MVKLAMFTQALLTKDFAMIRERPAASQANEIKLVTLRKRN